MRGTPRGVICALVVVGLAALVPADVIYDESISGDLSSSGLASTVLTVSPGSNELFGTTGKNDAGVVDRDYFSFTVPLAGYFHRSSSFRGRKLSGRSALHLSGLRQVRK